MTQSKPTPGSVRPLEHTRAALVFGIGGFVSGMTLSSAESFGLIDFAYLPGGNPGHFPLFLLWPGTFLLIGLGASFAICWSLQWLKVRVSFLRWMFATTLMIPISLCATLAGGFGAFATALVAPTRVFAVLLIFGLIVGVLVAVALLSVALFLLTDRVDYNVWIAMLIFAPVVVAASIGLHPNFLGQMQVVSDKRSANEVFLPVFLTLHILGYTFYAACAGLWLARPEA